MTNFFNSIVSFYLTLALLRKICERIYQLTSSNFFSLLTNSLLMSCPPLQTIPIISASNREIFGRPYCLAAAQNLLRVGNFLNHHHCNGLMVYVFTLSSFKTPNETPRVLLVSEIFAHSIRWSKTLVPIFTAGHATIFNFATTTTQQCNRYSELRKKIRKVFRPRCLHGVATTNLYIMQ